tara:strand:+ start:505 stop:1008 length:504 start_codon:yes stop_codon:yes gene_type:complete
MAIALFIKRADLVKNTIINGNVDTDKFLTFIEIAQEMHIQNYLGTDLYNKISADIVAGNLAGDYLSLINNYVQKMLIHYAMVDYLPFAAYEVKNGGLFKHRSENSETPSKEEVDFLVQRHRTFADFYTTRFLDYMSFNSSTKFPEYYSNTNEDMYPDKSNNFLGWIL